MLESRESLLLVNLVAGIRTLESSRGGEALGFENFGIEDSFVLGSRSQVAHCGDVLLERLLSHQHIWVGRGSVLKLRLLGFNLSAAFKQV